MDNGKNFVVGKNDLLEAWKALQTDKLRQKYQTTFKFNVPLAPHRNGLVERMVGGAKRSLLHKNKPQVAAVMDKQLAMAFAMVESVRNSRPLTYVGSDLTDIEPLAPEYFLAQITHLLQE